MKKCKWAGDVNDEYCKSCDGIKMMVEGLEKPCNECNGYEEGTEDVEVEQVAEEPIMNPPVEHTETPEKPVEDKKVTNTTTKKEKPVKTENKGDKKGDKLEKVSEEKKVVEEKVETPNGIQVTSLRYTSSATVKKGDNYYKLTAEEEWNTCLYEGDIHDVREQLWATLNSEVDLQIDKLNNM